MHMSSLPHHISLWCISQFIILCEDSNGHIVFAGAVYTDGPSAEVLSVILPLCVPETNVKLRTLAARHFGALKKAVFSLSQCYNQKSSSSLHSLPDT